MSNERSSLQKQLDEAKENLGLIEEQISKYVLGTQAPIQLYKEKKIQEANITKIEEHLSDLTKNQKTEKQEQAPADFDRYKKYIYNKHCHLPNKGFETSYGLPVLIEKVYIRMQAKIHNEPMQKRSAFKGMEKQEGLDIKEAFNLLKQKKIKDIMILGDPGSGKTTLLKYITVTLIDGRGEEALGVSSQVIPFYTPLREWKVTKKETFEDFMERVGYFKDCGITIDDFKALLNSGNAIILLDGLDEITDRNLRLQVIKWIDQARALAIHTHFVITSRFTGYTEETRLNGNILELFVNNFTLPEIIAFLNNWYTAVEVSIKPADHDAMKKRTAKAELISLIKNSEQLQHFVSNPLILQITALVHMIKGYLPNRRVELYEECTNILLEKWDKAKQLENTVTVQEARQILRSIALWLHQEDKRQTESMKQLIKPINAALEKLKIENHDPEKLFCNIQERSGIFIRYGQDEYGFIHLSFQEYLAAEEIRNNSQVKLLVDNYRNHWWREVILLCLTLNKPSIIEEFIEAIVKTKAFEEEITLITDAINDSKIKPVSSLAKMLEAENITLSARLNILTLLGQMAAKGIEDALSVLEKAAKGKEERIRIYAYNVLKEMGKTDGLVVVEEMQQFAIVRKGKDKAEMVLIPAGPFLYGSKEDDKEADQDEKPQRVIELTAYYIDIYPVTNSQFCMFLNEEKPRNGQLEKWINLKGQSEKEHCRIKVVNGIYKVKMGFENYPVIYVTWFGATAYAEWAEKRLPTEEEWEKAARGSNGRIYPWGNEWRGQMCNSAESKKRMTTFAGKYRKGKSIFGCYDMAGNVCEWTGSIYNKNQKTYTLRGGAWSFNSYYCRCPYRYYNYRDFGNSNVGFRCAKTF